MRLTFVTKTLGMPCATPSSVFLGSSTAWRRAARRLAGYVSTAARCSAVVWNWGCWGKGLSVMVKAGGGGVFGLGEMACGGQGEVSVKVRSIGVWRKIKDVRKGRTRCRLTI
jgi:hypothetical protein